MIQGVDSKRHDDTDLIKNFEYSGSNLLYFGLAKPGSANGSAVWRIYRLTWSGSNLTAITLADGNSNFDNIWNNRTSLSYS